MSLQEDKLISLRKRLAWRASRRGIREMDLLVGGFADVRLTGMSLSELEAFQALLEIPDQQLLAWVTGIEEVPVGQRQPLLMEMLRFRPQSIQS